MLDYQRTQMQQAGLERQQAFRAFERQSAGTPAMVTLSGGLVRADCRASPLMMTPEEARTLADALTRAAGDAERGPH